MNDLHYCTSTRCWTQANRHQQSCSPHLFIQLLGPLPASRDSESASLSDTLYKIISCPVTQIIDWVFLVSFFFLICARPSNRSLPVLASHVLVIENLESKNKRRQRLLTAR